MRKVFKLGYEDEVSSPGERERMAEKKQHEERKGELLNMAEMY